jgi:hypothetical protein
MSMYWVYDLPNFLFGLLVVAAFVVFGLVGLAATRGWVRRLHVGHSHNDIVGFYLAAVTVFYGITLGLLAVGTWTTYSDVETRVDQEATAVGALYRDISSYPEPARSAMENDLRDYTRQVIDVGWPQQQRGVVPTGASAILSRFQKHLVEFEPTTKSQEIVHAEVYRQFNQLVQSRRGRLDSVTKGLSGPLWTLVLVGALISIALTWFFEMPSLAIHVWMTVLLSALFGLMIFLVAAMDNPFRGKISVGPEPLERVYEQLMK